jgi:hypothetical protein
MPLRSHSAFKGRLDGHIKIDAAAPAGSVSPRRATSGLEPEEATPFFTTFLLFIAKTKTAIRDAIDKTKRLRTVSAAWNVFPGHQPRPAKVNRLMAFF